MIIRGASTYEINIGANQFLRICGIVFINIIVILQLSRSQTPNIDSLKKTLTYNVTSDSFQFNTLIDIGFYSKDPKERLIYSKKAFHLATENKKSSWKGSAKFLESNFYTHTGNLTAAIETLKEAESYYINGNNSKGVLTCKVKLAEVYKKNEEYNFAEKTYLESIETSKIFKDTSLIAAIYLNLGELYRKCQLYDKALFCFFTSKSLYLSLEYDYGIAYAKGNIGLVNVAQDNLFKGSVQLKEAISILNPLSDNYSVSVYQEGLAHVYQKQGNYRAAEEMANSSLALATEDGLIEQIRDANFRLSEIYYQSQQYRKAYEAQAQYVTYKDSLINEKNIREIENLRRQYEVAQKQAEVDELTKKQRYYTAMGIALVIIVFLLAVMALILYRYNRRKKRVNQQLQSQQKELEQLNQTKDHFFSIISHDLRSPIATFQSIMEVFDSMVENRKFDDLKHVSLNMKQSSNYIMELVENLFSWGMNQKGAIPFQPEPLMLQACVGGVVDVLGVIAQNKSVALKCDIHSSIQLEADEQMLQAIIRNLINNALKFTHTGGRVTISANESKEKVSISVADTGVGIHPDHLPTLFELDAHKSTPGTDNEKGVGLGLQLVHEFVEKHDGKIEVKSKLGKGTEMVIILPKKISKQCQ